MGARVATERSTAAIRSPVSWALLGLVIQRPSYGYELVQRFERTFGDALLLSSPSQIYTALDTLTRRALIKELSLQDAPPQAGRQPKPHYRATLAGVSSYQEWLIAQAGAERRRGRLFARQLAMLAPRDALSVIDRYEQACLTQATHGSTASTTEDSSLDGSGRLAERLLREEDRLAAGARLSWIEYARREFTALVSKRSIEP